MSETPVPGVDIPAIERTLQLAASPQRVWRAITEPEELSRWFPDRAELELRAGGPGQFSWAAYGSFALRVEAIDPPTYFAWSWTHEPDVPVDQTETTLVEWRLRPTPDGGTVLTVRESGFTRPEHRIENDQGWTSELAELVSLLASDTPPRP